MKKKMSFKGLAAALMIGSSLLLPAETAFAGPVTGGSDVVDRIYNANPHGDVLFIDGVSSAFRDASEGSPTGASATGPGKQTYGPAQQSSEKKEEEKTSSGPHIEQISIAETYHDDYGIYEEAMGETKFFYSNISNGGITDQGVFVDLPAGIDCVMEKDGVQTPYSSRQTLRARGSYILNLSYIKDASLPFSEQTICKAVFRFRIQDKLVKESEAPAGTGLSGLSPTELDALLKQKEKAESETVSEETELIPETEAEEETEEETGETEPSGDIEQVIEEALGEGYGESQEPGYSEATGLTSAYDPLTGYYRHQLATDAVFYTDIPNGMVTDSYVTLMTNDDLTFEVRRNGELVDFESGSTLEIPGSYIVYAVQDSTIFRSLYPDGAQPSFRFRILDDVVNDLGIYNAPQGSRIADVIMNGESASGLLRGDDRWVYLRDDGQYEIRLETEAGTTTVHVNRDTCSPKLSVSLNKDKAMFEYLSDDVAYCRVEKDGEEVYNDVPFAQIESPGKYHVEVYDRAGNMSVVEFEMTFHMNAASIIVIIAVILLIIGLVFFIRRTHKQMKVL